MVGLAGILLAQRRSMEATRLLGSAQAVLDETADQLTAADREMLESHQAQAREHFDPQTFHALLAEGYAHQLGHAPASHTAIHQLLLKRMEGMASNPSCGKP